MTPAFNYLHKKHWIFIARTASPIHIIAPNKIIKPNRVSTCKTHQMPNVHDNSPNGNFINWWFCIRTRNILFFLLDILFFSVYIFHECSLYFYFNFLFFVFSNSLIPKISMHAGYDGFTFGIDAIMFTRLVAWFIFCASLDTVFAERSNKRCSTDRFELRIMQFTWMCSCVFGG